MKGGTARRTSSIVYSLRHLLGRRNEELFPEHEGVNIGGRRIKCIRFADVMALLAEGERMLKNMSMELNDRCKDCEMKII